MGRPLIVAFFIAAALMTHAQASSWNVSSRMAAIESLVDRGTFQIDRSPFVTGDKYRYAGHFYSDKPPAMALAGAAVALPLRIVHVDIVRQARIVMYAVSVVTIALPFALAIGALYGTLRLLETRPPWAAAVATIAGSATLAYPYATVLINHVPAAACLLGAVYALVRARSASHVVWTACAGFLLGLSVGIDTSFVIFLVCAPLVIGRPNPRAYLAFVAGAIPPLLGLVIADLALSGSIRPPDTNAPLFDWPGSDFASGYILGSVGARSPGTLAAYTFHMLFGSRGLFLYSPILLVGVLALVRALRTRVAASGLYLFIAVSSTIYIASTIFGTVDYGGDAYGMRRFVGISLLLCLPLGTIERDLSERRGWRTAFLGVLAVSIVFALIGVGDPFSYRPFPLLAAVPGMIAFTLAHRTHGLLNIVALALFGSLAYAFVARTLPSRDRSRMPLAAR